MAGKPKKFVRVNVAFRNNRQDPEGKGRVYTLLRFTKDGKEHTEIIGWLQPEDVEERRRAREAELMLGILSPSSKSDCVLTLGDLVRDYLPQVGGGDGHKTNMRNRTLHLVRLLGSREACKITTDDYAAYVDARRKELGGRRGNRRARMDTLFDELKLARQIINRAWRSGVLRAACAPLPNRRRWVEDRRPARRLTEKEVRALEAAARETGREELADMVVFCAWCARRPIAIYNLRRRDCARILDDSIPRTERHIWISRDKGQKELGWGPLTQAAYHALRRQLLRTSGEPDALVWRTAYGHPYNPQRMRSVLLRLCTRAKIQAVNPYDLRKHAVLRIYLVVRSLHRVLAFSGHASTLTLERHYLSQQRGDAEAVAPTIDWTAPTPPQPQQPARRHGRRRAIYRRTASLGSTSADASDAGGSTTDRAPPSPTVDLGGNSGGGSHPLASSSGEPRS